MQNKNEQRKHYRWIKKLTLKFSDPEGQDITRRAVTENISEGGLQLVLPHELKIGQSVMVTIELMHDPIPIQAACKVVHISPERNRFCAGLQFTGLENFQKVRLLRYLNEEER